MEVQDLILAQLPDVTFDLYNRQIDEWDSDYNEADHLSFPAVLLEFVGGDWSHDGLVRECQEYYFRLHLVVQDYRLTHSGQAAAQQKAALEHLDQINTLANVLDQVDLTHATRWQFIREEIDTAMSQLINHSLDFMATVIDDSLNQLRQPTQVVLTSQQIDVSRT